MKIIKRIIYVFVIFALVLIAIDLYVQYIGSKYILSENDVPKSDAIIVLGAYVLPNGQLSWMLKDRMQVGIELYSLSKANRLLVTGDHGQKNYDEVNSMRRFALEKGIINENVFMDHAGFNTYDSMYRAKQIFCIKKAIIVTQKYHLKRAVFIARSLGIEAYGVPADLHDYGSVMNYYQFREAIARIKDFFSATIFKPKPKFLGDTIPIWKNGSLTNDL